ncbi:MAG: hypothetical protein OEW58_10230 [Gammaproteobacteria bacterium]|nr:hypothetical protein [Gammaproteobacteria bacterium]
MYDVDDEQKKRAKQPHELFLINLIFNHVLVFVAALGLARSMPWLLLVVPLISIGILSYTLWRAKRSLAVDSWFVMCHWQLCAVRSRRFLLVVFLLLLAFALGWVGYHYWGLEKIPTLAMISGLGILPTMVTVLVLVILESDALHQASNGRLPAWVTEKFPNTN